MKYFVYYLFIYNLQLLKLGIDMINYFNYARFDELNLFKYTSATIPKITHIFKVMKKKKFYDHGNP